MVISPEVLSLPFDGEMALLAGGGGHMLISTKVNLLFSCGWNSKGQLGQGDLLDRSEFEQVQGLHLDECEDIVQLSCGWDTSAVLTTRKIFVFGGNNFNQLGPSCEASGKCLTRPQVLQLPGRAIPRQVELSLRQIVIRTDDEILISGKSQAVEEIRKKVKVPQKDDLLAFRPPEGVEIIAAGQHHMIYATEGNHIMAIGQNKFNQSENLKFPERILKIRSGWTHNACLLASSDVYLWGRNTYGQVGNGEISHSERDPIKLNINDQVAEIHLGSEHGLVQSISGSVYTWGWNEHGNCGNGSEENVLKPEMVNLNRKRAIMSCTGSGFCFVVTE